MNTRAAVLEPETVPLHIGFKMPEDVARLLQRKAFETGRSKQSLVLEAIRNTYGNK